MIKSIIIINRNAKQLLFWTIILFLFYCCSQNQSYHSEAQLKTVPVKSPVVTAVKAPVIIRLDSCSPPRTIAIPTKKGNSSIIDTTTRTRILLQPPLTHSPNFLIPFQNYHVEQGLAGNAVRCSYVDKSGNVWFGTVSGGVSRFDGKSFTNFTTSQGLAKSNVERIIEDNKGNMWFGTTGGGGLSCYNGKSFTTYTTAQGLVDNEIYCFLEDKRGNLWVGTKGGVSKYDGKSFVNFTTSDGLVDNVVGSITEDKSGNLWFGTLNGISRYDGKMFQNYSSLNGWLVNHVHAIIEDTKGNLWIGTFGGVIFYDGKSFKRYTTAQGLLSNSISSILEDKTGSIWIGSWNGGVVRLAPDTKHLTTYTTAQGLAYNYVNSMVLDKNDNLWIATDDGISFLDRDNKLENPVVALEPAYRNISGVLEDRSGNLWISTFYQGVFRLDSKTKTYTRYTSAQGMMYTGTLSMVEDKAGNIWFGGELGATRLDSSGRFFTRYTTLQGLPNDYVQIIYQDKSDNLWFGTLNSGLTKLDADRRTFTTYTTAHGLPGNTIASIFEDKSHNLWLGTIGGGVCRLEPNGKFFTIYTTEQGLPSNSISTILQDNGGRLWFGGERGLSLLNKDLKTFTNYTTTDGLIDDRVYDMVIDRKGLLWVGTNKGFTLLKGFTQDTKQEPKSGQRENSISLEAKPNFEIYSYENGYPIKGISYHATCITRDNMIWAGTEVGLLRFDYNSIHKNTNPPNAFIQSVKIDNEPICWHDLLKNKENVDSLSTAPNIVEEVNLFDKVLNEEQRNNMLKKFGDIEFDSITPFYPKPLNLVLPYEHNSVTFDFAAREYTRSNLVRYQFILEGYHKDWSPISNKTSATFGNIYEGNYSFKLKAQSPDGVWSEPLIYTFKVLPPWYRTWWAYTLYLIIFLAALWGFIKWRVRTLKKEKVLLEEKVTIRTHELQEEKEKVESTLTELKSTQAQLIQSEKMASLGELTAGIAHEIQNPLNFVNNFSDVNQELLAELKEEADKGNIDELKAIANDVIDNSEKINHHGKRADAIVKGMLQHSRASTGKKEPTNINALADEYLRLSYHGMRAKDKSFNATLETDFDATIGKINVVPQDIGRVLINLFNNAFYAVMQKQKGQQTYVPTVKVVIQKLSDKIEIKVADNGIGMPQKVVDKIFQPFFTTKPTGQGTGLGLSLAYDIVKAHGGDITVESTEGEGTEFVITLQAPALSI